MVPDAADARHLDSSDVASYLDRALPPVERERVEAHLADCSLCREEVIQVSRLRHSRAARRGWLVLGPITAAAAIAVIVISRPSGPSGTGPILRDGGAESSPTVFLVSPADRGIVERHVSFTWRSVGARVSYRVTVTDERGDVLWSSAVADTTARLPGAIVLPAGRPSFWYVDALLPDGRSVTSGVRRLMAPR